MLHSMCLTLMAWAVAAPPTEELVKQELTALSGTWEIVGLESDAKQQSVAELKEFRRIQEGDHIVWKKGDQTIVEVDFRIDLSTTPKSVDSTYTTGDNKGQTHRGIYRLDGDDFTMCFAGFGKPRPTEFATTPGSGLILYKARRVEKK